VVTTPPSAATAWKTTAYSGPFGAHRASTSPRPNPRSARPAATDPTARTRSPYVSVRPVGPSISAGRSPRSAACSRTNAGRVTSGTVTSPSGLSKIIDPTYPARLEALERLAHVPVAERLVADHRHDRRAHEHDEADGHARTRRGEHHGQRHDGRRAREQPEVERV